MTIKNPLAYTHLIQRLDGPRPYALEGGVQPHHIFGAGLSGLSGEAWKLLDPICTVDYMGAAEYEFGTLPKGFNELAVHAQEKKLKSFAFLVGPHQRELNYERKYPKKGRAFPPAKYVTLYGIAHEDTLDAVQERIRILVSDSRSFSVKCGTNFGRSLDPITECEISNSTQGWFELNNTFLFFSNLQMWKGFCDLFEVQKCDPPEAPVTVDYTRMDKKMLVQAAVNLGMFTNKTQANKVLKPDLRQSLLDAQEETMKNLSQEQHGTEA